MIVYQRFRGKIIVEISFHRTFGNTEHAICNEYGPNLLGYIHVSKGRPFCKQTGEGGAVGRKSLTIVFKEARQVDYINVILR